MTGHRLFVAIDLPEAIGEQLARVDPRYAGLTFNPPGKIHLTLAFFARVDSDTVEVLREKLGRICFRAFFLPVTQLGIFRSRGMPHVLWVGVGKGHPHLFQLHKRINEAALRCNLPIEERAWTPHFTIARARGVSNEMMSAFLKKTAGFEAGMFRVDTFHLYQSQLTPGGAVHQRIMSVQAQPSN